MPVNINGTTGVTTPSLASTDMPTSGGDPVVESGSNSDGEWTRWADGTQDCTTSQGVSVSANSCLSASFVYPLPFTSISASFAQGSRTDQFGVYYGTYSPPENSMTGGSFYACNTASSAQGVGVNTFTRGRWK